MLILVTRPGPDAERTASSLSALGHRTLIDSVIKIEALPPDIIDRVYTALAFTSANAVRVAAANDFLKNIRVFAVGARTAQAAQEYGFERVTAAGGDVHALGERIVAELPSGAEVLHLAGEHRAGDLVGILARNGIKTKTTIIYRARFSDGLKPETVTALREGRIGAVLHYSERSAAAFVRLAEAAGVADDIKKIRHLCLSSAVAEPLKSAGASAEIAASPDEEELFKLLGA